MRRLLSALGEPQTRLAPAIHVAGTNGKGSVVANLLSMASAGGLSAHVYTSPHLVRFNERIMIASSVIDDERLADLLTRVEAANAGDAITFFEATTAAAFLGFSETPADLTLLEVGLGGRFDATNVITDPACAVVTSIGMDHAEFLGSELTQIAREKAGVFKAGRPAVIGPQDPSARAALVTAALEAGADPIRVWGSDFEAHRELDRIVFEGPEHVLEFGSVGLIGGHQIENAGVAAMAAIESGLLPTDHIAPGVAHARWPGRLQEISHGPLYEAAFGDGPGELWIDGAHNPPAAEALARALADLDDEEPRPLVVIAAMQATKDRVAYLNAFVGLARLIVCAPLISSPAPVSPEDLAASAAALGLDARVADTLEAALSRAADERDDAGRAPRIVITGSLYFVGEALARAGGRSRRPTTG